MKIAPLADVKARLSAYIDQCETDGPIIITRNGKSVAVLLAPDDDEDLERLTLSRSPQFRAILEKSRKSFEAGKGISHKEFWKMVAEQAKEPGKPNKRSRSKPKTP
jgi:prevent-host-death family protein